MRSSVFSPNWDALFVACEAESASSWDPATGHKLAEYPMPGMKVHKVALSRDGRLLAAAATAKSAGDPPRVYLFDRGARRLLRTLPTDGTAAWTLAFSADGKKLIVGSNQATALIFDISAAHDEFHAPKK